MLQHLPIKGVIFKPLDGKMSQIYPNEEKRGETEECRLKIDKSFINKCSNVIGLHLCTIIHWSLDFTTLYFKTTLDYKTT